MTEIELHQGDSAMSVQMSYARAVSSASMLPQAYRGKPADIMLAVGLGQSMGLSPAESLYRIDVIQGKPTASAELIAANVRKAGHRLRVRGDDKSCTATIVRHDDPEFEFTVTRDETWAKAMQLNNKDNYKKQPGTMLQWRAISAVARLACPEALYGVAYTPDEMGDFQSSERPAGGLAAAMSTTTTAEHVTESYHEPMAEKSRREMFALFTQKGITEEKQLAGINQITGADYESRGDLAESDCRAVIDTLRNMPDATPQPDAPDSSTETVGAE